MSLFNHSYTLDFNAPPAMEWDAYSAQAMKNWKALLESPDSREEPKVHRFLERNPCLMPQPVPFLGEGQAPHPWALITKPPIPGAVTRIPDFMWITSNSSDLTFTFIEIEAPSKEVFRESGVPTAHFTEAKNQIDEWRALVKRPGVAEHFRDLFKIPDGRWRGRSKRFLFKLIMGRSSEMQKHIELVNQKRLDFLGEDAEHMTFDRLSPGSAGAILLCIKTHASEMQVVSVPPTYYHSPFYARYHIGIDGLEDAIRHSDGMSQKRQDFLIQRIPYWRNWVFGQANHSMDPFDKE